MGIDRLPAPPLSPSAIDHHLEMEVRDVLGCVAGRSDEAEYIALPYRHPLGQSVAIVVEVGVIVDELLVRVELVNRYATRGVLPELEDRSAVRGDDRRPARRHDVHRVVSTPATPAGGIRVTDA